MTNFATDCKIHHILKLNNIFYFSLLPSTDLIKTSNNFHQFSLSQYHNKNLTPTLDTGKNIGTWKQLGLRPAIRSTVSKFKMYNMDRSEGGGGGVRVCFCKMKFITFPNYQKCKHNYPFDLSMTWNFFLDPHLVY